MSKVLIDTNAYTALLNGNKEIARIFDSAERIIFPFIAVAEILAGFRLGTKEEKNRALFRNRLADERTSILYADFETAEHYSSIFAALRRVGTPIPTNDIWIAAIARQHELPLCSLDAHFQYIEGLTMSAAGT
ncbi:MAG TPA: type II toxin-antitoxin system VapC family toxin [Candidatus Kapabacteria bacterium]|jgi:tRNA(fMet)-specific endonuclease VapC|nr:type II toxin-antitoxin system VapC family toxin [Candidatus Kapabacteria bacterium]